MDERGYGILSTPSVDGDSVETLLKNADSAMYRAKEAGRARYEFFNVESNDESRRLIELERDLRAAFAAGQLEVYYQPQFDLETGVISGAEALLITSSSLRRQSASSTKFVIAIWCRALAVTNLLLSYLAWSIRNA